MNINFYLPGLTSRNLQLSVLLKRIMDTHPEMFYDNFKIGAFYGCFRTALWNGGRLNERGQQSLTEIEETITLLKELDIPIRYTYTNGLIRKEHLQDTFCNKTMELADNNSGNGVIVSSDILESYLRDKYPSFKYILSSTKFLRDLDSINKATDKYDMVVLDGRDVANFDFLNKIENKQKVEIMLNLACDKNCSLWEIHFRKICAINLGELDPSEYNSVVASCPKMATGPMSLKDMAKTGRIIQVEDIFNKYIKMGFSNFKIVGRVAHLTDVLDAYLYYLCKPEYTSSVKAELIKLI